MLRLRRCTLAAVATISVVLVACGGRESGRDPAQAPQDSSAGAGAGSRQIPAQAPDLVTSAAPVISPSWPRGWKVVETSRSGPDASPVVWFHLSAPERHPDDAVHQTLDILRPLAGTPADDDVTLGASRAEAVGQIRGPRMSAAVVARVTQDGTDIEIALELFP